MRYLVHDTDVGHTSGIVEWDDACRPGVGRNAVRAYSGAGSDHCITAKANRGTRATSWHELGQFLAANDKPAPKLIPQN